MKDNLSAGSCIKWSCRSSVHLCVTYLNMAEIYEQQFVRLWHFLKHTGWRSVVSLDRFRKGDAVVTAAIEEVEQRKENIAWMTECFIWHWDILLKDNILYNMLTLPALWRKGKGNLCITMSSVCMSKCCEDTLAGSNDCLNVKRIFYFRVSYN